MLAILIRASEKDKANTSIVKELCSEVHGKGTKKWRANLFCSMEIFSKVSLKTIQDTMVCTGIKMVIHTKEHGRTMLKKDLES